MKTKIFYVIASLFLMLTMIQLSTNCQELKEPPVISALPGNIPSDAIILFDGTDLSKWSYADGRPAGWIVKNGEMMVKGGSIKTNEEFGDMQLHLEFCTPAPAKGKSQDRGNSGVYFLGNYEVQVLDSYENSTYWDGSCGAIYKQHVPLVNASRPPGIWQVYDIVFHPPQVDVNGQVIKKATLTVFHNGVLIQDNVEVKGPTGGAAGNVEKTKGSILLQDHNHPVKYRNIWVRQLPPR